MRSLSLIGCIALVAVAGCRRDAAEKRSQADKAEEKAQQATLTSGSVDNNVSADEQAAKQDEADDARDKALAARAASLVAFRNEQLRYRSRIEAELTKADDDKRRSLLNDDLTMIDRATEQDWAPLRGELDRHLDAASPTVTPRRVPR